MKHYLLFVSKSYSFGIMRPLADAIAARGDRACWYVHGVSPAGSLNADDCLLESVESVREFDPAAVFAPGNWVPDFFPGIKVEIFHGFGIEKKGHFRIRGFFDLYCTHGPLTTAPFRELAARYGFFEVTETGWPKMDPLFTQTAASAEIRGDSSLPTVLYAPTFSPNLTSAEILRESIASLAACGDTRWLIKFHPKMTAETVARYRALEGPYLEVRDDPDIVPLLQAADVMVSDTSSVVAEFLLLDKPVVTVRTAQPGEHVLDISDPAELGVALERALSRPDELIAAGRRYAEAMHPYTDGQSSRRVLEAADHFIEQGGRQLRPKPLNLKRRLAVRLDMGYFHWH